MILSDFYRSESDARKYLADLRKHLAMKVHILYFESKVESNTGATTSELASSAHLQVQLNITR